MDSEDYKNGWDTEYRSGHWRRLESLDARARYSVIAGYVYYSSNFPNIMDVGCGHGVLAALLDVSTVKSYTGIDISGEAINQAQKLMPNEPKFSFIASSVEDFNTDELYDCIVFDDILYYLDDPIATISRYTKLLAPGGSMVVCMFRMTGMVGHSNRYFNSDDFWKKLQDNHKLFHALTIQSHQSIYKWDIALIVSNDWKQPDLWARFS